MPQGCPSTRDSSTVGNNTTPTRHICERPPPLIGKAGVAVSLWRRGRDSNPRDRGNRPNGFRVSAPAYRSVSARSIADSYALVAVPATLERSLRGSVGDATIRGGFGANPREDLSHVDWFMSCSARMPRLVQRAIQNVDDFLHRERHHVICSYTDCRIIVQRNGGPDASSFSGQVRTRSVPLLRHRSLSQEPSSAAIHAEAGVSRC